VLVATDIAARGLDISQLPQVVNFELPHVPEDYIHRIGRTGRAGATGAAISLVDREEMGLLRDIERLIKRDIPKVTVEGFVPPAKTEPEAPRGRQQRRPQGGRNRKPGEKRPERDGQSRSDNPQQKAKPQQHGGAPKKQGGQSHGQGKAKPFHRGQRGR